MAIKNISIKVDEQVHLKLMKKRLLQCIDNIVWTIYHRISRWTTRPDGDNRQETKTARNREIHRKTEKMHRSREQW